MLKKYVIALTLYAPFLAGQTGDSNFDEGSFRKAVQAGLPPDPKDRADRFALGHEEIAIPILVTEIKAKAKLTDPETDLFILKAANLAIYKANQRAVDVVADLCQTDQKRFSWLVAQVLNSAVSYQREYELAYYAVEHYPILREAVMKWLDDTLKLQMMDVRLARELLKREKAGHLYWVDDPLLSGLPAETRDRVDKAVEKIRFEPR
jgi:hypothetical protein